MNKKRFSFFKGMSFNLIAAITLFLIILGVTAGAIGYVKFTDSLTAEYNDSAFRTAETAGTLINPDSFPEYLKQENIEPINILVNDGEDAFNNYLIEKGYDEQRKQEITALAKEYALSLSRMNILCQKQNVTLLYAIAVNTTDYESFISVFNCVNAPGYTPWNLGEEKYTTKTNENSYERIYKDMYTNGLMRDNVVREYNLKGKAPHITSLVPVCATDGTVVGILCVQRPMSELSQGRMNYLYLVALTTLGLIVLAIIGLFIHLHRQFVRPIRKIMGEAERFARENKEGDGCMEGKISHIEEIKSLANSVSKMEKDTLKYIDHLSEVIGEKQRIGTELKIASIIQESSLPSVFPPYPDRKDIDIYASMSAAKEIGGDFYDFFLIDDNHLALVMADVSGKGVAAALFMMVSKILINEITLTGGTPAEILEKVNDRICNNNKADLFVTVWLGILDLSTGKLTYANAGHDDPALMRDGKDFEFLTSKHGFVIGGMKGLKYRNFETTMNTGDKIFLYTDGLPEATDKDGNMFKMDRVIATLNEYKDGTAKELIDGVHKRVDEFVNDAPQFDDLTMLCFSYNKNKGEVKMDTLVTQSDIENLEKVLEFIDEFVMKQGLSEKAKNQINLASEEIFTNVCRYAYDGKAGEVKITVYEKDALIYVAFADDGKEYNPLENKDPDVTLSAEERDVGGLGIYLVKKLTDGITYERKDGKNILILEKKIWKN